MGCGASSENTENVTLPGKDLYEKKELIGVGHHGRVYRCIYQVDHKQYAIKVISQLQNHSSIITSRQKYMEMIAQLKALKHPRISQYLYAELGAKELSIVMQLAKEGTLKKYIQKQGKLTQELTSRILEQILEGLYYLHTSDVMHKDLKPNNILMFPNQIIKLSDFVLAELYDSRFIPKEKLTNGKKDEQFHRGDSLPYIAPQIVLNQGITLKSDVWSVGCIAVEMLTGKLPWTNMAPTFQQVFKVIRASAYPSIPPNLSKSCQDFLRCCLAVNPSNRWNVKQLLKHSFINKNGKEEELYFQLSIENVSLVHQENDKTNKMSNNKNKNGGQEKIQQIMKTPINEKRFVDENYNKPTNRKNAKSLRISNNAKNLQNGQSNETAKSLQKIALNNDISSISRDDILPQINEDQQDMNIIVLNNKKVKIKSPGVSKIKTQPTHIDAPTRSYRNSIDLDQLSPTLKESIQNNYQSTNNRISTQPNLLISEVDQNKEYFKRPLKLLKKRINESKQKANMNNSNNFTNSFSQNQSSGKLQIQRLYKEEKVKDKHKIRSHTQSSREEVVIDTQLARAERDRYINEQLFMKRQREEEKEKWEQQLKKEAEILKKQFSHRYAYPFPHLSI